MRHIYAIRNRSAADRRVRDAVFAHARLLDPAYRVGPGELMSRASSDSEHVARMMDSIGHTIGYVLTVVAVSVVMLALDVELALIVLIPLPVISVGAWIYSRRYDARTRLLQEAWANAATLVEETVSGIRIVKGLGAGDPLSARFRRRSDELVRRGLDVARLDAVFNPLEALPIVGTVAVLWLGGRRVIAGDLTLGSFVAFNAYVVMLVWPLRILGQRDPPEGRAAARRYRAGSAGEPGGGRAGRGDLEPRPGDRGRGRARARGRRDWANGGHYRPPPLDRGARRSRRRDGPRTRGRGRITRRARREGDRYARLWASWQAGLAAT
jgi:ATP-binding cassette, subfamily B, bacterial